MSDKGFHTVFVLGFLLFMILRVYFFRRAAACSSAIRRVGASWLATARAGAHRHDRRRGQGEVRRTAGWEAPCHKAGELAEPQI